MSFVLRQITQQEAAFDGFAEYEIKLIPEGTVLDIGVTSGACGMNEAGIMESAIHIKVISDCEFKGQSYKYVPKLWDADERKRDLAIRNLAAIDRSVGYPFTRQNVSFETDAINEIWAGRAVARVKFGVFEASDGKKINFVRGFAPFIAATHHAQANPQPATHTHPMQPQQRFDDEDIGF